MLLNKWPLRVDALLRYVTAKAPNVDMRSPMFVSKILSFSFTYRIGNNSNIVAELLESLRGSGAIRKWSEGGESGKEIKYKNSRE